MLSRHAGGRRHRRRAQVEPRLPACRQMVAYEHAAPADIRLPFRRSGRARSASRSPGIRALTADSYTVRSTISPTCSARRRRPCRRGSPRYEIATAGRCNCTAPRPTSAKAVQAASRRSRKPATRQAGLAAGARDRASAALRRALDRPRWCSDKPTAMTRRRLGGSGSPTAASLPLSLDNARRQRKLDALRRRVRATLTEAQGQAGRPGRAAGAPGGAGRRDHARQQDRRHPRHGGRLLLSAEPAQPRHPVAAPARLRAQAADLSRGAAAAACSPTRWCATSRSRCRRSAVRQRARSRLLDAEELPTAAAAASLTLRRGAGEFAATWSPCNLLDGGIDSEPEPEPRPRLRPRASRRRSISDCVRLLSLRSRRPAGAAHRHGGVLRRDRQRRPASRALWHRIDRAERPPGLYPQARVQVAGLRRPAGLLPDQDHAAGRGGARHGAGDRAALALCGRQDRDQRRRERRLVRRLHQRRHGRQSGSATTIRTASGARSAAARPAASVAVPIFEPIIQAAWAQYAPPGPAQPPSAEAKREMVARPINLASGDPVTSGGNAKSFVEYFRRDRAVSRSIPSSSWCRARRPRTTREVRGDETQQDLYSPYDNGGRYAPPLFDPWRLRLQPSAGPAATAGCLRSTAYGQPQVRPNAQQPQQPQLRHDHTRPATTRLFLCAGAAQRDRHADAARSCRS